MFQIRLTDEQKVKAEAVEAKRKAIEAQRDEAATVAYSKAFDEAGCVRHPTANPPRRCRVAGRGRATPTEFQSDIAACGCQRGPAWDYGRDAGRNAACSSKNSAAWSGSPRIAAAHPIKVNAPANPTA